MLRCNMSMYRWGAGPRQQVFVHCTIAGRRRRTMLRNGNGPAPVAGDRAVREAWAAGQAAIGLESFSTATFMRALSGAKASLATFTDSSDRRLASATKASKLDFA